MSQLINPHTGEITWHKGGRGRTPNGKSYQEYLNHPTAQYRMTFSQWEENRLKKYKPKKDTKAHAIHSNPDSYKTIMDQRSIKQANRAAYGPYKPNTEGKYEPYAKELVAIAELQFEIRALLGSTKNVLFARTSGLKSLVYNAIKHKRDVTATGIKVTSLLEEIQVDFVKYETKLKRKLLSKHPNVVVKAKTQLDEAVNYKARFATSGQQLAKWLNQN